jgi:NADPH2:quinone reductase
VNGIRVERPGGPDVLEWAETEDPTPDGGLLVELTAAGVNFIDVYHRTGLYPLDFPIAPGVEGAGVVRSSGSDAFSPGDRVAWASGMGSYSELVRVPAEAAVRVPDDVDLEQAAAVLLQGATAHYLVHDTFRLGEGTRCLVHAGAGGVGHLLIQMAKRLGAEVFTTVGSSEKARIARSAGADHVIEYRDVDFADAIREIAGERPLDVVYDGVGADVFDRGLDLLAPRGMMVSFGNASGPVEPVAPLELMRKGSLFLTRPTIVDYFTDPAERDRRANDLFAWLADGSLEVRIGARLPLREAAEAHRMLEGRRTTGKVLLLP